MTAVQTDAFQPEIDQTLNGNDEAVSASAAIENECVMRNVDHTYNIQPTCHEKKSATARAKTNCVDDELTKQLRYLERRRKNNVASKRSRETKKNRMKAMEHQSVVLEEENNILRARISKLEKLTTLMKSTLVQRVS